MTPRTPIGKCRTSLQLPKTFVDIFSPRFPHPPQAPNTLGCGDSEGRLVLWKLQLWRFVQTLREASFAWLCPPWEAQPEMLQLANKDSVRIRQRAYLSVKLEDCNPNRSETEDSQRLNTHQNPQILTTLWKASGGRGALRAEERIGGPSRACFHPQLCSRREHPGSLSQPVGGRQRSPQPLKGFALWGCHVLSQSLRGMSTLKLSNAAKNTVCVFFSQTLRLIQASSNSYSSVL